MTHQNSDPTKNPEHKIADSKKVMMREVVFGNEDTPILETWGLGPCIGIAAYDPSTKTGGLAHLAKAMDERESVESLLQTITSDSKNPADIRVWVRGGQRDTATMQSMEVPGIGTIPLADGSLMARDYVSARLAELNLPEENVDIMWDESPMGAQGTRMMLDTQTGRFETSAAPSEQSLKNLGSLAIDEL